MKTDKVDRIYNSFGVDLDKLQKSLDSTVMLAIVQSGAYSSDDARIVVIQSLLSDNAGNQYALTLSGLAIPIDLLEAVQSPGTIMSDLKWAVAEK
jgi:hypothetical protein